MRRLFWTLRALLVLMVLPLGTQAADITLTWNAPLVGSTPTGYYLYHGATSGHYTTRTTVPQGLTGMITNLSPGATLYIAATAYNAEGREGGFSNEVVATIPPTPPLPDAPGVPQLLEVRIVIEVPKSEAVVTPVPVGKGKKGNNK